MTEPETKSNVLQFSPVTMFLMLVLAVTFIAPYVAEKIQYAIIMGEQRAKSEIATTQLAKLTDTSEAFRLVVNRVAPTVVHIQAQLPLGEEDEPHPIPILARGQGSGVVVDSEGHILTNNHVIEGAKSVLITMADGRRLEAHTLGTDRLTDLALLKIDASNLISAEWGESDTLAVGDWVLAVGSPFGLDHTVTAGIVSAKGRRRVVQNIDYQDFLQTDAAVNPGSSGGPLVDLQGNVVGINTAIVGQAYQGISFAIPSKIAQHVYEKLKAEGKVRRGYLGVILEDISPKTMEKMKLPTRKGALVVQVLADTPADKAGLQPKDVILKWNDVEVDSPNHFRFQIAHTPLHSEAIILVLREGAEVESTLKVMERPTDLNP